MRLALLVVVLSVSGCASLITGGPLIREGEPTGVIEVRNQSGISVDAVLISACSANTYGLNRLPRDARPIRTGASYRFEVSAGCWDVDAGNVSTGGEARQRMTVAAGRTTIHRHERLTGQGTPGAGAAPRLGWRHVVPYVSRSHLGPWPRPSALSPPSPC